MQKHFLDSSVAQPMLLGSSVYRKYFAEQFAEGKVYVSHYVQMEIRRSCIIPFINFYFLLDMPNIETIGDALAVWSNKFRQGEIKAVMRLVGELFNTHQLSYTGPIDKSKAVRILGRLIKRIESQLRRKFINIGVNTTRCARAEVSMVSKQLDQYSVSEQLEQFLLDFNDTELCRSKCNVDTFFLNRFNVELEAFLDRANTLDKPRNRKNQGFVKITEKLQTIVQTEGKACSCKMCGSIGDAIIALEVPEYVRLEHTDYAFDNLCEILNKSHKRHPPETEVVNSYSSSST